MSHEPDRARFAEREADPTFETRRGTEEVPSRASFLPIRPAVPVSAGNG
jgi:hypothetical protein